MLTKKTHDNENIEAGRKIDVYELSGIVLKIITLSFGMSAMILISLAIASPNGITYYEDRMSVKIIEILFSILAIICMLYDLKITIKGSKI